MLDKKSNYAKNKKNRDAILYNGVVRQIALSEHDFSNRDEFKMWKRWSDEDYKENEKKGRAFYDHSFLSDTMDFEDQQSKSAEDVLLEKEEIMERKKQAAWLLKTLKKVLTKKQYRRVWLYYAEGWTISHIAQMEGVKPQSVEDSLKQSKKKIKKFFQNT